MISRQGNIQGGKITTRKKENNDRQTDIQKERKEGFFFIRNTIKLFQWDPAGGDILVQTINRKAYTNFFAFRELRWWSPNCYAFVADVTQFGNFTLLKSHHILLFFLYSSSSHFFW